MCGRQPSATSASPPALARGPAAASRGDFPRQVAAQTRTARAPWSQLPTRAPGIAWEGTYLAKHDEPGLGRGCTGRELFPLIRGKHGLPPQGNIIPFGFGVHTAASGSHLSIAMQATRAGGTVVTRADAAHPVSLRDCVQASTSNVESARATVTAHQFATNIALRAHILMLIAIFRTVLCTILLRR